MQVAQALLGQVAGFLEKGANPKSFLGRNWGIGQTAVSVVIFLAGYGTIYLLSRT
jgi:hypothetical protein